MKVIFTIVLLLMTIGLTACGILLWRRRKETGDYSRHIQAIFSWLSALTTFVFIFRTWNESLVVDATLFEPEHTFVPLLMQMTFFLYPLEVIRPSISKAKVYALLLAPPAYIGIRGHVCRHRVHYLKQLCRPLAAPWRVQRVVSSIRHLHDAILLFFSLSCPL